MNVFWEAMSEAYIFCNMNASSRILFDTIIAYAVLSLFLDVNGAKLWYFWKPLY